jgi:hypothetical protein
VKNSLSPMWTQQTIAETPNTLDDLRLRVPCGTLPDESGGATPTADHADAEIAVGSNAMFRTLAMWARRHVQHERDVKQIDPDEWHDLVEQAAVHIAGVMLGGQEKARAFRQITPRAQLVADWTLKNVQPPKAIPVRLTPAEVRARKSAGGWQTTVARSARTSALILAAKQELTVEDKPATQAAVLAHIQRSGQRCSFGQSWPASRDNAGVVTKFTRNRDCSPANQATVVGKFTYRLWGAQI